MSTTTCRWALACCCTSWLAAVEAMPPVRAAGGPTGGAVATPSAIELEVDLAARPDVYLRVDVARPALEVKAKGVVLETLPVAGVAILVYGPGWWSTPPTPPIPDVWRVAQDVGPSRRQLSPGPPVAPSTAGSPGAAPPIAVDEPAPAVYTVALEGGWELLVGPRLPSSGVVARWSSAVATVWRRLVGRRATPPPPRVAIALDLEAARRLRPLLRRGVAILLAPP